MKTIILIISISLFLLVSCTDVNNNINYNNVTYYTETWSYIKNNKKIEIEDFNNKNIYFWYKNWKNISIKVHYDLINKIEELINIWWYNIIHIWHKLDFKYVSEFWKLFKKENNDEIIIVVDSKYINLPFIWNLSKSKLKNITLLLNPLDCEKKIKIDTLTQLEIINSKNIKEFNYDRCNNIYEFEDKNLLD